MQGQLGAPRRTWGTLVIGKDSTVGHGCVVHCREVGEQALVGNGSTLLDHAVVGPHTGRGRLGRHPGTRAARRRRGSRRTGEADETDRGHVVRAWVDGNPPYYQELARRHRDGAVGIEAGA